MAGTRKARADITPEIRGAWIRAAKLVKRRGKSLSELIADAMEKDIITALSAISKFLPKETNVTGKVSHHHTHGLISETDALIASIVSHGEDASPTEPGETRPILPH